MASSADNGEYSITWNKKPLGFSIVMDTSGQNAYVSSIQRPENVGKGLKLAAQIIQINEQKVVDKPHAEILDAIKKAKEPITLKFQPRSFANDPNDKTASKSKKKDDRQYPRRLEFSAAPKDCTHVNGAFELLIQPINGKPAWQRADNEEDPILLYFWPKEEPENARLLKRDVWMIGRRSKLNKQDAYACVNTDMEVPTDPKLIWKCYRKEIKKWKDCELTIVQEKV